MSSRAVLPYLETSVKFRLVFVVPKNDVVPQREVFTDFHACRSCPLFIAHQQLFIDLAMQCTALQGNALLSAVRERESSSHAASYLLHVAFRAVQSNETERVSILSHKLTLRLSNFLFANTFVFVEA
jgi:hypothetical protein